MKPPVVVTCIISRNREKSTAFQNIFFDGDESGGGAYSRRHNLMGAVKKQP
jgi:hypothetical protein